MSPAELAWLPHGFPDPIWHVAAQRYLLVGLALLWAVCVVRARPVLIFLAGLAWAALAVGFWVPILGRPYGLLNEPRATCRAADLAVAGASGLASESFVVGPPGPGGALQWFAAHGAPVDVLERLVNWLPMVWPGLVALAVIGGWRASRMSAVLAAGLWLAFGTGSLEALRGVGFVSGMWAHPEAAVLLLPVLLTLMGAARLKIAGLVPVAAAGLMIPWMGAAVAPLSCLDTLRVLTFDQGAWLFLGLWGLWRNRERLASLLTAGGAVLLVSSGLGGGRVDPWLAQAVYRLGLILAAVEPVERIAELLGHQIAVLWPRLIQAPQRLGLAALLLVFVPGSFLASWDPLRLDPVALASRERLSPRLMAAMSWIRRTTPREAVFLAAAEYAPAVAALGGRRVLRAPTLRVTRDDERRRRLEYQLVRGLAWGRLAEDYRVRYAFIAPGDFGQLGLSSPEALEGRAGLRRVYVDSEGYRVFELNPNQAPLP